MHKIVISLASLLTISLFASEASALPSFARQTGMACNICHQQHFPILNKFGRLFKASGYTLMGAQPKVEGDYLSIPDTLNGSILVKVRYQKNNQADTPDKLTTGSSNGVNDGMLQFGDEFSLFFSGRVAENIGFMFEGNTVAAGDSLMAGAKIPIMFDAGDTRLSVIPFTTDALSVQYGYELSSGGVMRANRWAEHRRETSAIQYNADQNATDTRNTGAATGFAFVAQNDFGYINFTKWSPNHAMGGNGSSVKSYDMSSRYFRAAATPSLAGWDYVVGIGAMGGESLVSDLPSPDGLAPVGGVASLWETRQTFVDLQAQGVVGEKELAVYAQYAKAPIVSNAAAVGSLYGAGATERIAATLGADYSVMPNVLSIGAAYRGARNGGSTATVDNAITFTAVYDMAMNVALHANYTKYSGSAHEGANALNNLYTLMLEAAW